VITDFVFRARTTRLCTVKAKCFIVAF